MTKLKLEMGKYYLTRDGRKVGPMTVYADILFSGRDEEFGAVRIFHADGQHFVGYEEYDLIAEWTDTPTLKVGDKVRVVARNSGHHFDIGEVVTCVKLEELPCGHKFECDVCEQWWMDADEYEPIHDATTNPVITETVKRIVPGVYGKVEICEDDSYGGGIGVYVNSMFNRDDLTAAIETLTAIRDAL